MDITFLSILMAMFDPAVIAACLATVVAIIIAGLFLTNGDDDDGPSGGAMA